MILTEVDVGVVVLWLFFWVISLVVCGAIAGNIASKRDASYGLYFALGFFFGVIGILAAAFSGNTRRQPTVINNYYAVGPDGSHTLMATGPGRLGAAPVARSTARSTLGSGRVCRTPGCSAAGRNTMNDRCLSCHESTHAVGPMTRAAVAAPHRRDLETRACPNDACSAVGDRTSNLVCRVCRTDTVMGYQVPPRPAPVTLAKSVAPAPTRFPATTMGHGPTHLLTRRCADPSCTGSVVLTSDLVCRACRRDTALA